MGDKWPPGGWPAGISPLHQMIAMEQRQRVVACIDHDLSGPQGSGFVFATCSKCGARFKVKIEEL